MGRILDAPPTPEEVAALHEHSREVRERAREACEYARLLVERLDARARLRQDRLGALPAKDGVRRDEQDRAAQNASGGIGSAGSGQIRRDT
jgi:hypothetical protein